MTISLSREFRLSPTTGGSGISCDASGAFIGSIPLLKRGWAGADQAWEPHDTDDLSRELSLRFGLPIDVSSKANGLSAIARALNAGDIARAQIATLLLQFPDPSRLAKSTSPRDDLIAFVRELHWSGFLAKVWDESKHPRWPGGTMSPYHGGWFAPLGADDSSFGFVADQSAEHDDTDVASNSATLRRAWERYYNRQWPKDPKTGRNQDVAHIKARADGGDDHPTNYRPLPRDEHINEHREAGDFIRWAKRRWSAFRVKGGEQGGGKAGNPAPGPAATPRSSPAPQEQGEPEWGAGPDGEIPPQELEDFSILDDPE